MKDILNLLRRKSKKSDFTAIKLGLISPEKILSISYGEVRKPETINYRTFKAERYGLFCAKTFGPIKDYECLCGKYKRLKHRGVICEKCGVELTLSKVRRSRMGHIVLATPIVHVWFLRSLPSKISTLLNISLSDVERILCFEQYVVVDPGISLLRYGQFLEDNELNTYLEKFNYEFKAKIGAEAILELLKNIDLYSERRMIKIYINNTTSDVKLKQLYKRLNLIESFINSDNKIEWMLLTILPILPPGLRPLVPLDTGRFASSDLNDLYRRVINRNNRLKKLMNLMAPDIIVRNEKRMLQEAVDALLDNGKRGKTIYGSNKRPLKSLADIIKGKQGRFRQNLLGKRVDYSGRSVIVVGPKLKLHQCGLPKKLALELFKPFIFGELKRRNLSTTIKRSKKMVEEEHPDVWDILADIIYQHPVLLNRAPTLHRLGIQAFEPVLIEGKAIQLHPLVCSAFNADFDGDQMAVHIPLTLEAQLEARLLMLSVNNILSPASGEPIILPSQDMVLGIHYLSKKQLIDNCEIKFFNKESQVERAYDNNIINLHTAINFKIDNKFIETTLGRLIIMRIMPKNVKFQFINKVISKKDVSILVKNCYKEFGITVTVKLLGNLMKLGFYYATKSGLSIGFDDLIIPKEKEEIIDNSKMCLNDIDKQYSSGLITKDEKYNKIIDIWSNANEEITEALIKNLAKHDKYVKDNAYNAIYIMTESGARGSVAQIRQLSGIRGLMAKPDGSIIETPITANFREGLSILQYFISTHGARKGLADTALKTANSGYLTRRLVDVAQDVVITNKDCLTDEGLTISAVIDGGDIINSLKNRIVGRVIQQDIISDNSIIVKKGTLLSEEDSENIEKLNIKKIKVRSVIKCELKSGVCARCYGKDLTTNRLVNVGEAIGVIAAQSIGEPGTQLTMRTFHIGGAASKVGIINNIEVKNAGIIKLKNTKLIKQKKSNKLISISRSGEIIILDFVGKEKEKYKIPYGAIINVSENSKVQPGDVIVQWDPHNYLLIAEMDGVVDYYDLIDNVTIKSEIDEITGLSNLIIMDPEISQVDDNVKPSIRLIKNNQYINYFLSPGTIINVYNKQLIKEGDIIAKMPKETSKVRDITGGLPKVANIFEARKPKDPAILSKISGTVSFSKEIKGKKQLVVKDEMNNTFEILIPRWKNINVFEDEKISKGDIIASGQHNLHDILNLLGVSKLTEHIKKEVQDVYRLQGVKIDDKHIEVIIKQMIKKAIVKDPGQSNLQVDKIESVSLLKKINIRLRAENKKEIIYERLLFGITKASLTTSSFISAASFQETTRVLTEAAVNSKKDKLLGLKENVIVGRLIPAGTGFKRQIK